MPLHDWTKVDAGTFHAFHVAWCGRLMGALNNGALPGGYYAMAEQHGGRLIADVLTLQSNAPASPTGNGSPVAVVKAPPRTSKRFVLDSGYVSKRRTIAVRHVSNHRLVAVIEIISRANKDRDASIRTFASKMGELLAAGCHALIVDVFPPGKSDPRGLAESILEFFDPGFSATEEEGAAEGSGPTRPPVPAGARLLASLKSDDPIEAFVENPLVGDPLAEMPLFLSSHYYIDTPLETTYTAAFAEMPAIHREALALEPG